MPTFPKNLYFSASLLIIVIAAFIATFLQDIDGESAAARHQFPAPQAGYANLNAR